MWYTWYTKSMDFFSHLSTDNREKLIALGEEQLYKKNEIIFQAGSPGNYVYFLRDGRAKIYQLSESGKEIIQWFCFPGEMFGLAEVSRGGTRDVYARACSPVKVIKVEQHRFKEFLAQDNDAALLTIDLLSCRLRTLGDMLMYIASDDVMTRLIKLLSRLSAKYGKHEGDLILLSIPLTHQEIADMISASRQTVSTAINKLKRDGVITTYKHYIQIKSADKLASYIQVNEDESSVREMSS